MTDELKPCHEAFHDEQMTIWASEIIEALALTDALDFTTYVQKIEAFDVVRRELKVIGEQVAAWNTRPEPSVQEAARGIMQSKRARHAAFDAMWQVAQKHSLEATNNAGARYSITGDVVNEMLYAALRAIAEKAGE